MSGLIRAFQVIWKAKSDAWFRIPQLEWLATYNVPQKVDH
jgi:hypothetical protein